MAGADDEDEFTFTPFLEPDRDKKVLDLLPEYLTEEITFSRQNAVRFYLKILNVCHRLEAGAGAGGTGRGRQVEDVEEVHGAAEQPVQAEVAIEGEQEGSGGVQ